MSETHTAVVSTGVQLAWQIDDCTDGWTQPETLMLLHGIAETGDAFKAWVPHLARHFRVLRLDLRGYGGSSRIDEHEPLSIENFADDIDALVAHLGLARVHVMGAKLGAQAALVLAQRQAPWMASLSLAGVLISPGGALGPWLAQWIELVNNDGVEAWARSTMPGRMGTCLSPAAMAWWAAYMGEAPAASVKACFRMLPRMGEATALERIACPTLMLAAVQPTQAADFDQRQALADVQRWQRRIPGSQLREIQADSYHIAATHPDACAQAVLQFIQEISA